MQCNAALTVWVHKHGVGLTITDNSVSVTFLFWSTWLHQDGAELLQGLIPALQPLLDASSGNAAERALCSIQCRAAA